MLTYKGLKESANKCSKSGSVQNILAQFIEKLLDNMEQEGIDVNTAAKIIKTAADDIKIV